MGAKAPFPIIPELTGIAIAYRNRALIADQVLPRVTPVGVSAFKYFLYSLAEGFTLPDTKVGRRGKPNQVEFTAEEKDGSTTDYGLEDSIPYADIENAPKGIDPRAQAVEYIMLTLALDGQKGLGISPLTLGILVTLGITAILGYLWHGDRGCLPDCAYS